MPNTALSEEAAIERLHIAVGVIRDAQGRVLISERRAGTAGAGLWEFPGGKCESGETIESALARELYEELGIAVQAARSLIRIRHQYPDRHVLLDTWVVSSWRGPARSLEGQKLAWVRPEDLFDWELLPANRPISQALCLPDYYLITPEPGEDQPRFLRALSRSLERGITLVRLRAPSLDDQAYAALARACMPLCRQVGARLMLDRMLNGKPVACSYGLHLTAEALMSLNQKPDYPGWVSASCHNAQELKKAETLGCDFAILGTIQASRSHPGVTPIGWQQAQALIDAVNLPVYCIGGLGPDNLAEARHAGAQGIAAIRGFWAGTV